MKKYAYEVLQTNMDKPSLVTIDCPKSGNAFPTYYYLITIIKEQEYFREWQASSSMSGIDDSTIP